MTASFTSTAPFPFNRRRLTSTGDLLEVMELSCYGAAGWIWVLRCTTSDGVAKEARGHTDRTGRGLWEEDRQVCSTAEFSLPSDRQAAIRRLLRSR